MYGAYIDGTTPTVGIRAMTALKRDGSALIPASLVNVLKGRLYLETSPRQFQISADYERATSDWSIFITPLLTKVRIQ